MTLVMKDDDDAEDGVGDDDDDDESYADDDDDESDDDGVDGDDSHLGVLISLLVLAYTESRVLKTKWSSRHITRTGHVDLSTCYMHVYFT